MVCEGNSCDNICRDCFVDGCEICDHTGCLQCHGATTDCSNGFYQPEKCLSSECDKKTTLPHSKCPGCFSQPYHEECLIKTTDGLYCFSCCHEFGYDQTTGTAIKKPSNKKRKRKQHPKNSAALELASIQTPRRSSRVRRKLPMPAAEEQEEKEGDASDEETQDDPSLIQSLDDEMERLKTILKTCSSPTIRLGMDKIVPGEQLFT